MVINTVAYLDIEAWRETTVLVRRTTKLGIGLAQCQLLRHISILHAVFWWQYTFLDSGGSEENARRLLIYCIGTGTLHLV